MSRFEFKGVKRASISLLSAAAAVLLLALGSSAAIADAGSSHGGRSSMSSGRQGYSAGRMGRSVRGGQVRGGRYSMGRNRGGYRRGWFNRGWFNRGGRNYERSFVSIGVGSSRRGYRSSGVFFGFSFTASEYRRGSGLRYRRDPRREYRSDAVRENDSSAQRAKIEHSTQPGPIYAPLVASSAAPEVLPSKD